MVQILHSTALLIHRITVKLRITTTIATKILAAQSQTSKHSYTLTWISYSIHISLTIKPQHVQLFC